MSVKCTMAVFGHPIEPGKRVPIIMSRIMFYYVRNYVRGFCANLNQTGWFKQLCPNYVLLCFIMSELCPNYVRELCFIMFLGRTTVRELCFIMFLGRTTAWELCFIMFNYVRIMSGPGPSGPVGLAGSNQKI